MLTTTLFYQFEAILIVTFLYPLNTSENIRELWPEMWQDTLFFYKHTGKLG